MTKEEEDSVYAVKFAITQQQIDKLKEELDLKDKQIDLMSEQLTTPIHSKEYVKEYYERKAKEILNK